MSGTEIILQKAKQIVGKVDKERKQITLKEKNIIEYFKLSQLKKEFDTHCVCDDSIKNVYFVERKNEVKSE